MSQCSCLPISACLKKKIKLCYICWGWWGFTLTPWCHLIHFEFAAGWQLGFNCPGWCFFPWLCLRLMLVRDDSLCTTSPVLRVGHGICWARVSLRWALLAHQVFVITAKRAPRSASSPLLTQMVPKSIWADRFPPLTERGVFTPRCGCVFSGRLFQN